MAKRKRPAQVIKKSEPESRRKWLILIDNPRHARYGKPHIGCDPRKGISQQDKAERLSNAYMIKTKVVLQHEYLGLPDPDQEEES